MKPETITLITMRWPEYDEPVCAGHDILKLRKHALRILLSEHGDGDVLRPAAMCSAPITDDDLREWTIPVFP